MRMYHTVKLEKPGETKTEVMDGPKQLILSYYKKKGYKVTVLESMRVSGR